MERFGISVDVKNKPVLDPEFIPMLKFNRAFLQDAKKPVSIAVERADGQIATMCVFRTCRLYSAWIEPDWLVLMVRLIRAYLTCLICR